ncbi:hypothetical protein [Arthrobacter sunyaminii]|uniref:Uncharacterized protein n=1 Tax=Arthrobacter sunyaminii TaxID=2816859 RepID=A0A975XM53_9MICC|nr:hypothetical protein [Arthrobacter sunyaminii]MBO0906799.1 hypothetical protein [Arthrobacter sunyaminii]QWQ37566.1 hypothetical protein KG104_07530 [Arthrobacter sunyaminii]
MSRGKHHPPRPKPANSEGMLIANDLKKDRGWTDTQIKTFLPEPDQTARNPFSRKAAPMKLYALERVEAIEATPEYQKAREASRTRQIAARTRALAKKKEAVAAAQALELTIVPEPWQEMQDKAIAHFNSRLRRSQSPASRNTSKARLDRLTVNYLRHKQTSYEEELKEFKGVVGVGEAYLVVRNRILDLIADTYPQLRDECERQKFEAPELPDGVYLPDSLQLSERVPLLDAVTR